jgi:glutathione S-transferase
LNATAKLNYKVVACTIDESKEGMHTRSDEFKAMNPYHGCPTLKIGDWTCWEHIAVLRYMARAGNCDTWYSQSDKQAAATVDRCLDYRQCTLYPAISKACYPHLIPAWNIPVVPGSVEALEAKLADFAKNFLAKGTFVAGFEAPTIADLSIRPALEFCNSITDLEIPAAVKEYCELFDKTVTAYPELAKANRGWVGAMKKALKKTEETKEEKQDDDATPDAKDNANPDAENKDNATPDADDNATPAN